MKERRSLGIALSTTLVGVGLGAFFASFIALAALPSSLRRDYGWIPPAGMASGFVVVAAGIGVGVAVLVSLRRSRGRHLTLGVFLREARELSVEIGERPGDHQALYEQMKAWEARVSAWFDANLPEYTEHFMNAAGTGLRITGANHREVLLKYLEVHMQRISEVILEL